MANSDVFVLTSFDDLASAPPRPLRNGPVKISDEPVKVSGESLHPVLWQGKEWAVTEYGLEARSGVYAIAAARLDEHFEGWTWLKQIGEKGWADMDDFFTAYCVALVLHGLSVPAKIVRDCIKNIEID